MGMVKIINELPQKKLKVKKKKKNLNYLKNFDRCLENYGSKHQDSQTLSQRLKKPTKNNYDYKSRFKSGGQASRSRVKTFEQEDTWDPEELYARNPKEGNISARSS